jgi:hypothetical protein
LHGIPLSQDKKKTQCSYCGKKMASGGISRLKQHLVGGYSNVAKCPVVPEIVREQMRELIKDGRGKRAERTIREERMREALYDETMGGDEAVESDSDFEYPSEYTTTAERRAYKEAVMRSRKDQWEREQFRGRGSSSARFFEEGSGSQPTSRGSKGKGVSGTFRTHGQRFDAPDPISVRDPRGRQKTLKGMFSNAKEKVGSAISKFMFYNAIPAHAAKGPYMQSMVDVIAASGTGVQAPTEKEIMTKYLKSTKEELETYIEGLKRQWPEYGVTIMCDGWTSTRRQQIINFMVYCDGRSIFLKSVDASAYQRDHRYIYKLISDVIKEVGPENVLQVVTDNGTNFKKAGKKLMEKYNIFWTPCAAHCIDLILKDFSKTKLLNRVVGQARSVTTFIYNRTYLLTYMRSQECCGGDLIRPGVTRFATNYIALQSMLDKKSGLKHMFNSEVWYRHQDSDTEWGRRVTAIINSNHFWENAKTVVKVMEPIVKVLRLVDGEKRPTMGYLYEAMESLRKAIEKYPLQILTYKEIVEERWFRMLLHPLHEAGKLLNTSIFNI